MTGDTVESDALCERDGCENESRFLIAEGSLCPEHAYDVAPETTEFLAWGARCLDNDDSDAE